MFKNYLLSFISILITLLLVEVVLQIFLTEKPISEATPKKAFFNYSDSIGYEPLPFAVSQPENITQLETLNNEGARGENFSLLKEPNTLRIITIGNSVVQGFSVDFPNTWQQVLEKKLNQNLAKNPTSLYHKVEVLNLGVAGYVSWQALKRLENRGLKYNPDWVMVYTDVNDMVYSSLPNWKPNYDLSKIQEAHQFNDQNSKPSEKITVKNIILKSKIASLINNFKNNINSQTRNKELITQKKEPTKIPFNAQALQLYKENLNKILLTIRQKKSKMVLITWGFALSSEHQEEALQKKMISLYQNFPISSLELLDWYEKYNIINREFAKINSDVVLIDVAKDLENISVEERMKIYTDQIHQSVYGHSFFAEHIFNSIIKQKILTQ